MLRVNKKYSLKNLGDVYMGVHELEPLFKPRSIAVIGASRKPGKIGYAIVKNLLDYGFQGKIYPVNPKATEILGLKAYPKVTDIPDEVDMAVIVIPAQHVLEAVEDCGKKGVKVLVVITSGFSEVGNVELEEKMVELAHKYGMRILGPNIFGIAYTPHKMNATFGPKDVLPGGIAFITQSGALGIALMGWTILEEIGLSAVVSMGNMADIDVMEVSEYLAEDPNTKVITIYLEGLKTGTGRRFLEIMGKVTEKKPVIVIKSGRSERGAAAAASHTGSLAGADKVYDAAMKQTGILRALDIEQMFDWARAFALLPLPKGENTVIITNGGGAGVMATDAAADHGVTLLDPPEDLKEKFKKWMPWFGSPKNPVDLTGMADPNQYYGAVKEALYDDRVHAIVVLYCRTAVCDPMELANAIIKARDEAKKDGIEKPITVSMIGGEDVYQAMKHLNRNGIPAYPIPERAVSAIGALMKYRRYLESKKK